MKAKIATEVEMPQRIGTANSTVLDGVEAERAIWRHFGLPAAGITRQLATELEIVHSSFSEFDAVQMRGAMRFNGAVKGVRMVARDAEAMSPALPRWEHPPGLPVVLTCAERRLDLAVYFGDSATGNPLGRPTNAYRKGDKMAERVSANAELFPGLNSFRMNASPSAIEREMWVLLVYARGGELRAEFSLPLRDDGRGHIAGWRARYILPSAQLSDPQLPPDDDFSPDADSDGLTIDVPVVPRET